MIASTYEDLFLISRGRRREMGGSTVPRASLRGLGMAALHAVPSTRAPGRARRGLVGERTLIHSTLRPERLTGCGRVSIRSHAARQVAIMEPNRTPLCDWFEIR